MQSIVMTFHFICYNLNLRYQVKYKYENLPKHTARHWKDFMR